jgi:hypothetical protein
MKKLIVCCLIVLLGSCKDKGDGVDAETDFAPEFVGNYSTTTAFDTYSTNEDWTVERLDNNLLGITYKVATKISKPFPVSRTDVYALKNVTIKDAATFIISENADLDRDGTKLRAKVEGTGVKLTEGGQTKIGITFKITDLATNAVTTREYLEFKKK